ncbi:hypothetical protein ACF8PD_14700 [Vibrio plantisponsor]|uniref:hypothetical protein n=1 Tax=Vibrio plantisponsor TaxID=664643 RepID=UPI00370A31B4
MINPDKLSLHMHNALNILFISNREGTALGVLLGYISSCLLSFILPTLKTITSVDFEALTTLFFIFFWVFAFNIKPYLNRNKIDPKIDSALKKIEDLEKSGKISNELARIRYNEITMAILESVTLKTDDTSDESTA